MDPAQYYSRYPYDDPSRSQYLNSQSLSLDFHESVLPDPSYDTSYGRSTALPISDSPNLRTYTQSPTPSQSVHPPLQGLAVALSLNPISSSSMEETNNTVSISTAFHPGTQPEPDTVLCSSDGVLFYVHHPTLIKDFPNIFQRLSFVSLSDLWFRQLDVPSDQLNIILHALYGTSPAVHSPRFESLIAAVDLMPAYDITPQRIIHPSTPIYELLLLYLPLRPLELYALGAYHNLHSLAVTSSAHLLTYNLANITDQMAERIGAVCLRKLLLLHSERLNSLKGILLRPPHPHSPTQNCSFEDQCNLTRAWALVSADLAWDARPDLTTRALRSALNPLMENLTCDMCHQVMHDKVKDVMIQWSSVKCTI